MDPLWSSHPVGARWSAQTEQAGAFTRSAKKSPSQNITDKRNWVIYALSAKIKPSACTTVSPSQNHGIEHA
ncbi:hypothetical protein SARC_11013 [Sphaeroforma arctica JP610]|uniref:Uncharacterized protein n=1 Tax=Sphaeroforma arctica JP610 TaxID=667725 RepID=A0A0L0FKD2_9EUKA|nr:hypothetical protein SARC_11013 [Sphaeroforma arctica JP610]KNC76488.1 hypothetical protein SARC_11013 [Sphaeroforma arctica JP610]|eukprot:XP_014150390.1 hypothetical protein SARC_11013 [Sphaeroforma arctica JP610]